MCEKIYAHQISQLNKLTSYQQHDPTVHLAQSLTESFAAQEAMGNCLAMANRGTYMTMPYV